jgi:hypothetical protein
VIHDTTHDFRAYSLSLAAGTHLDFMQNDDVRRIFYTEHSDSYLSSDHDRRLVSGPLLLEGFTVPGLVPGPELPNDKLMIDFASQLKREFVVGCGSTT